MGAAHVFVADRPDVGTRAAAWAREMPDDDGAELVIEAVGTSAAVATAVAAAGRGGTVVLVGNVSPTIELPLQAVVTRQLRLQGSCAAAGSYPEAIRLAASGAVDLTGFVSAVAPLAEGPAWFERLRRGEPGVVKVVLCP
jgi:L-iditol 2-dehydrogenase